MLQKSTLLFNAMRKGGEEGWKRGGDLQQLGVNYRWSSIVVDERTPKPEGPEEVNPYGDESDKSLRAGDRAPDAPALLPAVGADTPTTLFNMFRPIHHTVLLFDLPAEETERVLGETKKFPQGLVKTVTIAPQGSPDAKAVGQSDHALIDSEGHAFAGYLVSPDKPTIVIVRPDGVVGGIVYGIDGFRKYFEAAFAALEQGL